MTIFGKWICDQGFEKVKILSHNRGDLFKKGIFLSTKYTLDLLKEACTLGCKLMDNSIES